MEAWLHRRLKAVEAHLDPVALATSARHAKVAFAEPPQAEPERYWYAPDIELHIWQRTSTPTSCTPSPNSTGRSGRG